MMGDQVPETWRGELEEEYERFSDPAVWRRTPIMKEEGVRFFLAWTGTAEGVESMTETLIRICPVLKNFLSSARKVQEVSDRGIGRVEVWLEAKLCMSTRKHGQSLGCFMLRLDPGSFQQGIVSTSLISPTGEEIGVCVFEVGQH